MIHKVIIMRTDYPTPSPDAPQPMSRGRVFIMISELNERYLGLAAGRIQPQSAHRSAQEEMKDLLAEIRRLYEIARMK